MRVALACMMVAACACAAACSCDAQEIHLYSEFERFDPFGNPVGQDREAEPREILSPAVARNGHLSLHVVITGAAGNNYLLYVGTNPPDILRVKLYREYFTPCGNDFCPDWLVEQNSPTFGAIPEFRHDEARPAMDRQTTRCYLLDIYAPPETTPRRVRVEALLKTGTWQVAPLEVRILAQTVPRSEHSSRADVASLEAPSSETARIQLFRYLAGMPIELPSQVLRVRDAIQRNAAEDMLLAKSLGNGTIPMLNLFSWWPLDYPGEGAEWYLKVRDFLYRFSNGT